MTTSISRNLPSVREMTHVHLDFPMDKYVEKITMSTGLSKSSGNESEFDLSTIGGRLGWLIKERGMKQADVARGIGVSENAISSIILGESKQPSAVNALKMCLYLEADIEFLLTGKGEPWKKQDTQTNESTKQLIQHFESLPQGLQESLLNMLEQMVATARYAEEGLFDKKAGNK